VNVETRWEGYRILQPRVFEWLGALLQRVVAPHVPIISLRYTRTNPKSAAGAVSSGVSTKTSGVPGTPGYFVSKGEGIDPGRMNRS
jgi:hypothetical protein